MVGVMVGVMAGANEVIEFGSLTGSGILMMSGPIKGGPDYYLLLTYPSSRVSAK